MCVDRYCIKQHTNKKGVVPVDKFTFYNNAAQIWVKYGLCACGCQILFLK